MNGRMGEMEEKMINPLSENIYKKRIYDRKEDIRGHYFRDQTAIIHSMPFRRLKNKTQVFFSPKNDHICTRIEHVLHVSTIAATICKGLDLDIDLAQAIALGHDLGHAPFGHAGEDKLNELARDNEGFFIHEVYSLRVVDKLAREGDGLNLTYAVRDGIISHCGEEFTQFIEPLRCYKELDKIEDRKTLPTTYEGCVVAMADKISYLGRDIEDAIKAKIILDDDIPKNVRDNLGRKNGEIIDSFVTDMIEWSLKNGKIGFSKEKFELMLELKDFNYKKIYKHDILKNYISHVERILDIIYEHLLKICQEFKGDLQKYNTGIPVDKRFGCYLKKMDKLYGKKEEFKPEQIVLDYVAGMTDQYALQCAQEIIFPQPISFDSGEL